MATSEAPKGGTDILAGVKALMVQWGLDTVKHELTQINTNLTAVKADYQDLSDALAMTQDQLNQTRSHVGDLAKQNKALCSRVEFTENKIAHLELLVDKCRAKEVDIEARSMKDTLVFRQIVEEKRENTMELLICFLKEVMSIKAESFEITRLDDPNTVNNAVWIKSCRRMGPARGAGDNPRPIIATFVSGADWVRKNARNLAGTDYVVGDYLPPEVIENKRKLNPVFVKAKQEGQRPRYVARGDVVAVSNKSYRAPVAPPGTLSPEEVLDRKRDYKLDSSDIITASGNRFVAHMATISSPADIRPALDIIKYSFHNVATATHNMYGTRIQVGQKVQEYSDDDGEHGVAQEIVDVLRKRGVSDKLVVVTRWASGIQLGRKRRSIVAACTHAVLDNDVKRSPGNGINPPPTPRLTKAARRQKSTPTEPGSRPDPQTVVKSTSLTTPGPITVPPPSATTTPPSTRTTPAWDPMMTSRAIVSPHTPPKQAAPRDGTIPRQRIGQRSDQPQEYILPRPLRADPPSRQTSPDHVIVTMPL